MRIRLTAFLLILLIRPMPGLAQDSTGAPVGSLAGSPQSKGRVAWVAGINVAAVGGSLVWLNEAWYKKQARTSFHTFNDSREWLQVDKFGHGWSAYQATRGLTSMWTWAGLPRKKAALVSSITSYAYMTGIEFLDSKAEKWGWSWSDVAANTVGIGMFVAQELAWQDQRIQLKFSFHGNRYGKPDLKERADDLFGNNFAERALKDYNAQTYWLSANLHSFFPHSKIPRWLNVSLGYGAGGMLGGFENKWENKQGIQIDRTDIRRVRQFYLSPDIDFTKIPTNSKFLKTTFTILNAFKFPTPALMVNNKGKAKLYAFYF